MKLKSHAYPSNLTEKTRFLMSKMLNPLCGLDQEIGVVKPARFDPNLVTMGGDLTGVHVLLGRKDPGKGAYHIGGVGENPQQALIKTLAESFERYSQLTTTLNNMHESQFCSYNDLKKKFSNILDVNHFQNYSEQQLKRENFPFDAFDKDKPITWVNLPLVTKEGTLWIPAQFLYVGYTVRHHEDEPWLTSAVTTGTASHSDMPSAIRNALLELIQIDSAMGHWYGNYPTYRIKLDSRVKLLSDLIERKYSKRSAHFDFYWLRNPDLLGFSIACVMVPKGNQKPRVAVGLGSDTNLRIFNLLILFVIIQRNMIK